ncbi:hypothetical protein [Kordiimonas pumila]|uniref:Uncharacterized protein n=1 Tax=Kordiimonas pumila TaxID=2161677 RepID=A0ABV7D4N3_9PROT|nr:hypothetical protein [Kordiimonas pumila]
MSTPPKKPAGQREGVSYAHKNRDNLPRANAPSGLSKTHMRSNFYVASDPERVRIQQEEYIAKQVKGNRLFKPSPYGLEGPAVKRKPQTPRIPREELEGIRQRMDAFKKTRMHNEAVKAQSKTQAQAQTKAQSGAANLDKMRRKALFMARRQVQTHSQSRIHQKSKTQKR